MPRRIPLYQVDAFAARPFTGNPAAICPLDAWLPDELLQEIAAENNLSETAFIVPEPGEGSGDYRIRWMTPTVEVDLCGHATLAAAHVLFDHLSPGRRHVRFHSRSGPLEVHAEGDERVLDFPAWDPEPIDTPAPLAAALGEPPLETHCARDFLCVYPDEAAVRALRPDMAALERVRRKVIVTAPGVGTVDFVSRFFAPAAGVPEDPVTGSAHVQLTPFWARRTGKTTLSAEQVSRRGGHLRCTIAGPRVHLAGRAFTVLIGELLLPG